MTNYLNNPAYSRGIRNLNPGNIKLSNIDWFGKIPFSQSMDASFEQFKEMRYGVRALMKLLVNYHKAGTNTVIGIISKYAPEFENNTQEYINTVAKMVGLPFAAVVDLTEERLIGLAKAIVFVENGKDSKYVTDADYKAAIGILGVPLKKKMK